jgi:ketosteroid isomerase-like protein
MTKEEFAALVNRLGAAATRGDGAAFAACFTPDAIYDDYIYGPHRGRAEIARMLTDLFHRDATDYSWDFFDPVFDGRIGYAWSLSAFTSKVPDFAGRRVLIDGMSRFTIEDGLIAHYAESVNGGIAMAQLGVAPERMAKVFARWSARLSAKPESASYLARRARRAQP